MEIKITEQIAKHEVTDPETKKVIKPAVMQKVIGYPDHKGKFRWKTEDELNEILNNITEVLEEVP